MREATPVKESPGRDFRAEEEAGGGASGERARRAGRLALARISEAADVLLELPQAEAKGRGAGNPLKRILALC